MARETARAQRAGPSAIRRGRPLAARRQLKAGLRRATAAAMSARVHSRFTDLPGATATGFFTLGREFLLPGSHGGERMGTITTTDGTEIFYKDWGSGQPLVFSHGWPLSADDWDIQMLFFLQHGYRVVASDRRGHGRSTQTSGGHDMDHYADDLAAVVEHLDLHDAVHIGHSTGGGEVVRYIARHGDKNVAKAAIISAVPPLMVKTAAN